ncbi:MAG: hypothetical protein J6A69_11270 [Clostridia bacterium]|nr:hypothetical protein [Clostridia bacterium]
MKTEINENDLGIVCEELSHQKELELVAERFNMTQEQALKAIIHEIYTSSVTFIGLQTALVLIADYEEESSFVEYDADGNIVFDDDSCSEIEVFEGDTAF